MQKSKKKYEEEEKIRKQMEYQVGENEDIMEDLSYSNPQSYSSHHPSSFYDSIFDADYPKRKRPGKRSDSGNSQGRQVAVESLSVHPSNNSDLNLNISLFIRKVS